MKPNPAEESLSVYPKQLRVAIEDGQYWFCIKDTWTALNVSNRPILYLPSRWTKYCTTPNGDRFKAVNLHGLMLILVRMGVRSYTTGTEKAFPFICTPDGRTEHVNPNNVGVTDLGVLWGAADAISSVAQTMRGINIRRETERAERMEKRRKKATNPPGEINPQHGNKI